MRLRRKSKANPTFGIRLESDGMHGAKAKLFLGDTDISSCVQRVEVDVSCGDVNRVIIHAIAADVKVDIEPGEIKVIERAYQISTPHGLEDTPIRRLLSEIEEEPAPEEVTA